MVENQLDVWFKVLYVSVQQILCASVPDTSVRVCVCVCVDTKPWFNLGHVELDRR